MQSRRLFAGAALAVALIATGAATAEASPQRSQSICDDLQARYEPAHDAAMAAQQQGAPADQVRALMQQAEEADAAYKKAGCATQ
ncbi:hypothetical protein AB0M68_37830 [Streptomyces sp. NPDC051453]|uniref:hypothetical protein n=1 Tax=Streptomyces sp. NPDC051453 TaxID=3154941 RepID=UPI00341A9073